MTDASVAAGTAATQSAGAMLRDARQSQGLQLSALAAAIKVPQKKLEALEADRFDELPDATFTRALAQTVCRSLKLDPAPVLARLPQLTGYRLEQLAEGINAPFHERPGQGEPKDGTTFASPAAWGTLLLVVSAAVLYLLPSGWLSVVPSVAPASAPVLAVIAAPAPPTVETVPAAAPVSLPPADAAALPTAAEPAMAASATAGTALSPAAQAASAVLQLRAKRPSWVEVQDANSRVLFSRDLEPGETVSLDGALPMRVKIGNAVATELVFRGQPLDLAASTRDNIARLELK